MSEPSFADQIASTGITVQPRTFHISREHRSLLGRSIALRLGLVLYLLVHGAVIGVGFYARWFIYMIQSESFQDAVEVYDAGALLDKMAVNLNMAYFGVMLFCVVTYCMFIHRAASNIDNASAKGLSVTPGWAVGWSFIPFVNFFKIYQVMREIWTASADPKRGVHGASMFLAVWWISYITGNIVSQVSGRMALSIMASPTLDLDGLRTAFWVETGASCLSIVAGVILFLVVGGITRNQARWKSLPGAEPAPMATLPTSATSALGF